MVAPPATVLRWWCSDSNGVSFFSGDAEVVEVVVLVVFAVDVRTVLQRGWSGAKTYLKYILIIINNQKF